MFENPVDSLYISSLFIIKKNTTKRLIPKDIEYLLPSSSLLYNPPVEYLTVELCYVAKKTHTICSIIVGTIRDWNDLPESLISSSELSDDSLSKFTSLVRARD